MRAAFFLLFICISSLVFSQSFRKDSTLQVITIQAYQSDRDINEVSASIAVVDSSLLNTFSDYSIVSAINTVPGIRMEERSPGSYRFSIRGSSIRSPFGIRNVKMYWNGLPFTDAGGNTYLNLFDPTMISSLEIIKGPGGSLYGAGTGGVLLLNSDPVTNSNVSAFTQAGSFGFLRYGGGVGIKNEKVNARIKYAHQQSDGYRDQSAMTRDVVNANVTFSLGDKSTLSAHLFYTDLMYETPGGLTLKQFLEDPSQARPGTNTFPGAVEQKAAVFNKTFFGGLTYETSWNDAFTNTTSVYGATTDFTNPSIREYEVRDERNVGLRSVTQYRKQQEQGEIVFTGGTELQFMESPIQKYQNAFGEKGDVIAHDDLSSVSFSVFTQADLIFNSWIFTGGLSANKYIIDYKGSLPSSIEAKRDFDLVFFPRVAVLKKFKTFSLFTTFSRGFSPPTVADLYPSGGEFSNVLQPEFGNNIEAGIKSSHQKKFQYEVSIYDFRLRNTIVRRIDENNIESFINAGKTIQRGVEAKFDWQPIKSNNGFISSFRIFGSYAYNHYRFNNYVKDDNDLSGNKLTGVTPFTIFGGFDITSNPGIYLNFSVNHVDHIPLNDENTAYAKPYQLATSKIGFKLQKQFMLDIFIGVDNAFNQRYSLGNDINALGGRFFNAAAPRNFFAGLKWNFDLAQK